MLMVQTMDKKVLDLIMIILIGILPTYYALNMEAHQYKIMQTRDSAANLAKFIQIIMKQLQDFARKTSY